MTQAWAHPAQDPSLANRRLTALRRAVRLHDACGDDRVEDEVRNLLYGQQATQRVAPLARKATTTPPGRP